MKLNATILILVFIVWMAFDLQTRERIVYGTDQVKHAILAVCPPRDGSTVCHVLVWLLY